MIDNLFEQKSEIIKEELQKNLPVVDGNFIWHGKGICLFVNIIDALVYNRDVYKKHFDINTIKKCLLLNEVQSMIHRDMPEENKNNIKRYLSELRKTDSEEAHYFIVSRFINSL